MSKQRDQEQIFSIAAAIQEPDLQREYLADACGDDEKLFRTIEQLLHRDREPDALLDRAPVAAISMAQSPVAGTTPGTKIGPYTLREQIGEGGMGIVYVAEQIEPVRRKVALKIIKPGMATRNVVARFEAERQALAMMDHPNVATVFDGGATENGHPFFAMELVQGPPVTEYCDQRRLNIRQRLKLFQLVCEAVEHAHRRGIIHRDLKPSNVVVPEFDGRAVPKVIDFGVAKALGEKLSDATVYTHFSQLVGTPAYMSPEQAGMGVIDVDTRSDVYSLGVLLYELLTGSTPFDREKLQNSGYDEMRRIIREDSPRRPSTRISTLAAEACTTIAHQRGSEPHQLSVTLRGELDCVVMKALDKDRDRRYESAKALEADIDRYLNNEVVTARPPSNYYRMRKFAQRNRVLVASLTLVFIALTLGVILATTGFLQAQHQRNIARQQLAATEKARATAEKAFDLLSEFVGAEWGKQRETEMLTVGNVMAQLEPKLTELLKDQPEAEIRVRMMFANRFRHIGRHAESRSHLFRALDLARDVYGERSQEVANIYVNLADELQWTGDPRPWSEPFDIDELGRYALSALEIYDALGLRTNKTSHACFCRSLSLTDPQERPEAKSYLRKALEIANELPITDPDRQRVFARLDLANFLSLGNETGAQDPNKLYEEARVLVDQLPGDNRTLRATAHSCCGRGGRWQNDGDRAIHEYETAWSIYRDNEDLRHELAGHNYALELAELYLVTNQSERADSVLADVMKICEERNLITSLLEIHFLKGWWQFKQQNYVAAEEHFAGALELAEDAYSDKHAMTTYCRFYLAESLRHQNKDDRARDYYALVEQHTRPYFELARAPHKALWMFASAIIHGNDEPDERLLHDAIVAADRAIKKAAAWEKSHLHLVKSIAKYKRAQFDDAIDELNKGLALSEQPALLDTRKGIPNSRRELQQTLKRYETERATRTLHQGNHQPDAS